MVELPQDLPLGLDLPHDQELVVLHPIRLQSRSNRGVLIRVLPWSSNVQDGGKYGGL
jgi:hypothetical protein